MTTYKYTFTVFTPTYNRAHTLHRVYDSLKAQTFRDFEWLIVDDGSTDGTKALVRQWQGEADFPIVYIWQEHAGKQVADNRGVQEAQGELFLPMASDDAFVPVALERFKFHWDSIPMDQKEEFSAVTGLVQDPNGNIIGSRFPFDPTDSNSLEIHLKYNVTGDKAGFQRTEIMRQFPYPDIEGETFITESLIWNRIALKYKTRYVNEVLKIAFPSRNSLSAPLVRAKNPKGARLYYREFVNLEYPTPKTKLLRGYANYVRFSCHAGIGIVNQIKDIRSPLYWLAAFPIGYLAYLRDRRLVSGQGWDRVAHER